MNVGPEEVLGEGENVEVVFDRDKIHLFDTDTERAITHGLE
jgi:multiple sugar transport system ATP-binding protein